MADETHQPAAMGANWRWQSGIATCHREQALRDGRDDNALFVRFANISS